MKPLMHKLGLCLLGLATLFACDESETLSRVGESIQAPKDKVESQLHRLSIEAKSVEATSVYSAGSVNSLLGEISDPVYGDFRGEYVARLRTARGFQFAHKPIGGKIDSVRLQLNYARSIGDPSALMKIAVYEVKGIPSESHSVAPETLEQYRDSRYLLGEHSTSFVQGLGDSVRRLSIPLKQEVGQRIYDLTLSSPELFATQASFDKNVLGGLLITPTTGRGTVVQVLNTALAIYYSYENEAGEKKSTLEYFISTKLTGHVNGLSNPYSSHLLKPSDDYFYVKQPAGIVGELRLDPQQMIRLLDGKKEMNIGTDWSLADAQLSIDVDNPSDLLLNPPPYMLLIPKDSVEVFFAKGQTERSRAATSYLSSRYSVERRFYNFSNIARLVTEHLKRNARFANGKWTLDEDLSLRLIPVDREVSQQGDRTLGISEYLFPSFVRLNKKADKMKIEVVSSQFKQ